MIMLGIFIIALGATTLEADMLIYDIGNVYSCPYDHMIKALAHKMDV